MKKNSIFSVFVFLFVAVCVSVGAPENETPLDEIYIFPILGHLDYGFTATQSEVESLWPKIYKDGIKFLDENEDAKLVSDSLLPVEWFEKNSTPEEWQRFIELVKSGRWELTAGLLHANTSVFSEAESRRLFYDSRKWSEKVGVKIDNWMHADVPGLTWNMAEAATDCGIKFVAVGANEMNGFSPLPAELPPLFKWRAPDGQSAIVSLHGGAGYMQGGIDFAFHESGGLNSRIEAFTKSLRKKGYNLDVAAVMFSSGDNTGPSILYKLMQTVREWNSQPNRKTILKIATLEEFSDVLLRENRIHKIKSISGDWPASGTWEALVRKAPHAENAAHAAKRNILAAEMLSTIKPDEEIESLIDEAWRNILLYDEHSGVGAWPGKLTEEQLTQQNKIEVGFAKKADDRVNEAIERVVGKKENSEEKLLRLICNTSDSDRSKILDYIGRSDDSVGVVPQKISAWSCGVAKNADIKLISPDEIIKNKIEIKQTRSIENALFNMEPQDKNTIVATKRLLYSIDENTSVVRLQYRPFDNGSFKEKMYGWIFEFSLTGLFGKMSMTRGGIVINSVGNSSISKSWNITDEAAIIFNSKYTTSIRSIDGIPFVAGSDGLSTNLKWLLNIESAAVEVKGGQIAKVPNEPDFADREMESVWVIEKSGVTRKSPISLAENAMPLFTSESASNLPDNFLLKTFRSSNGAIIIEEIKLSEFEKGIILRIRNISSENRSTKITFSRRFRIVGAYKTDGLERVGRKTPINNSTFLANLAPYETNTYLLRMD